MHLQTPEQTGRVMGMWIEVSCPRCDPCGSPMGLEGAMRPSCTGGREMQFAAITREKGDSRTSKTRQTEIPRMQASTSTGHRQGNRGEGSHL